MTNTNFQLSHTRTKYIKSVRFVWFKSLLHLFLFKLDIFSSLFTNAGQKMMKG